MATPTPAEREALIHANLAYAQKIAESVAKDLPRWVQLSDLLSCAHEGLIHAADRYDPDRGASFTTFAYYRIRGAIYDGIRRVISADPYHRARSSARAAMDDLLEASQASVPRAAGDTREAAANALSSVLEDAAVAFTLGEMGEIVNASTSPESDPERGVSQKQTRAGLVRAMQKLPERERTILDGVYFQNLTIEQAGALMGLTKSWGSRLHARALALMVEAIGESLPDL